LQAESEPQFERGLMKKKLTAYAALACLLLVSSINGQEKARAEKDLLGEKPIPADAYYGVPTARSLENFPIYGVLSNHYPGFIAAWAIVKREKKLQTEE
jgi:aspartate ammonia-lyase